MDDNVTSTQIFEEFHTWCIFQAEKTNYDCFFNDRHHFKNIFLSNNTHENYYIISFIMDKVRCYDAIDEELHIIMNKPYKIRFFISNNYVSIFIKKIDILIDILQSLSFQHPKHNLILVDGLIGSEELNNELFNHKTIFMRGLYSKNPKLINIDRCNIIQFHEKNRPSKCINSINLEGLMNTHFDKIHIYYMNTFMQSFTYSVFCNPHWNDLNYDTLMNFLDNNNVIEMSISYKDFINVPDNILNKITKLHLSIRDSYAQYDNEEYQKLCSTITKILSFNKLTSIKCHIETNMCCFNIISEIISNENLIHVNIDISLDDIKLDKFEMIVNPNIEQLRLTCDTIYESNQHILIIPTNSKLIELHTSYEIQCDKQIILGLDKLYINSDETIKSLANILNINNNDVMNYLCEYSNIKDIYMNDCSLYMKPIDMNNNLQIINLNILNADNEICIRNYENIKRNVIRNKTFLHYAI